MANLAGVAITEMSAGTVDNSFKASGGKIMKEAYTGVVSVIGGANNLAASLMAKVVLPLIGLLPIRITLMFLNIFALPVQI